jgi:hypothetical protein
MVFIYLHYVVDILTYYDSPFLLHTQIIYKINQLNNTINSTMLLKQNESFLSSRERFHILTANLLNSMSALEIAPPRDRRIPIRRLKMSGFRSAPSGEGE